jgi:hypothetical protein
MPAKSKQQYRYIWAMRRKYKSKKKAPKNMKWVFNKDWTDDIKYKDLPKKIKEKYLYNFVEFINEKYFQTTTK